jgi:uncharacterized protein (TIGR03435 family)
MDDIELLREYAAHQSEQAFETLVSRHVNLVYSVALRHLGNPHQAEEITQAVFVILAKKSGSLRPGTILSGWLYQTARLTSANFLRGEIRRQHREQEAHMQSFLHEPETDPWPQIAPLLDHAMAELGEKERNAIALRFFEGKNLREVGASLGVSEDAAKMRVNRAVDKLRNFFAKRGAVVAATALAGTLSANAVQAAPIGLISSTLAATKGTALSSSTLTLIKGTLKIMAWSKLKTAALLGAVLLGGTTTVVVKMLIPPSMDESLWSINSANLSKAPHILLFRPTKYPQSGGWTSYDEKWLIVNQLVDTLFEIAYSANAVRTVFPPELPAELPTERYDVLVNLPSGGREAFQAELKKRFGLIGRNEMQEKDVLILKRTSAPAPGLKISKKSGGHSSNGQGTFSMSHQPMTSLTGYLEQILKIPILDQTKLNDQYDIELKWVNGDITEQMESLKKVLAEQLGLELVPSVESIKMLIVERSKK